MLASVLLWTSLKLRPSISLLFALLPHRDSDAQDAEPLSVIVPR
jgi:hypothetical protein